MAQHNELGKVGEGIALAHLRSAGYTIKEANWRFSKDEIDIIAQKENVIVFVEVKTRRNDYFGLPQDAVTRKKQKFLIRAADAYIQKNEIDLEARYDIISVIKTESSHKIDHIEDAFYPTL